MSHNLHFTVTDPALAIDEAATSIEQALALLVTVSEECSKLGNVLPGLNGLGARLAAHLDIAEQQIKANVQLIRTVVDDDAVTITSTPAPNPGA